MRPAFRMGHQRVLSGIARIGFITIRDQCAAERLATIHVAQINITDAAAR